jgi:hypothetical protein
MRRWLLFMVAVLTMGVVLAAFAMPAIANDPDMMASDTPEVSQDCAIEPPEQNDLDNSATFGNSTSVPIEVEIDCSGDDTSSGWDWDSPMSWWFCMMGAC